MKKLIMRIVAVISVFTIITATTVPAFANDEDDVVNFLNGESEIVFTVPLDEFVLDDYVVPYDLYLEYMSGNGPSTYNAAAGVLGYSGGLAWSSALAAAGKTCATGGLYLLGLLCGGSIAYGVSGLIDVAINDSEQFYNDVCTLYNIASDATKAWLEEAFELYVAGESITIPVSVSQDIASLINGSIVTDGAGNSIDTSLTIDTSIIGGVFDTTFPDSLSFTATDESNPLLIEYTSLTPTEAYTIGGLTISSIYQGTSGSDINSLTITNNTTGATLTMPWGQFNYGRPQLSRLSKLYKVVTATCTFWTLYGSYTASGTGKPYTPEKHTKYLDNTMTFENTGTILDGLAIGGVVWDAVANSWRYVIGSCNSSTEITDDNSLLFPVDPIGLVLSNTGVGVLPGVGAGGITWPGKGEVKPNDDDKTVDIPFIPPVPYIPPVGLPLPGTDIGVPVIDNVFTNTQVSTGVDTDVLEADKTLEFKDLQSFKDFLGGLGDFFTGLFGWLPDDFENKLDGVWITLGVIILIIIPYRFIT